MRAEVFLERPRKIKTLIKNKLIEREQWWELAMSVTAYSDGDRVQSSGNLQKMSDAVAKCVDMQTEIDQLVLQLAQEVKDVLAVIEQIPTDEYEVLHMRYFQNLSNNEVAEIRGKGAPWASTMHTRGCKSVQRILDGRKL